MALVFLVVANLLVKVMVIGLLLLLQLRLDFLYKLFDRNSTFNRFLTPITHSDSISNRYQQHLLNFSKYTVFYLFSKISFELFLLVFEERHLVKDFALELVSTFNFLFKSHF